MKSSLGLRERGRQLRPCTCTGPPAQNDFCETNVSLKVKLNIVTGAFEMGGRARTGAESSAFHSPETLQVKPFPSRSSIYLLLKRLLTGKVNVKESAQQNPYTLLLAFFTPGEIVIEIIVKERLASPPRGA
jgi:hypothetical protein